MGSQLENDQNNICLVKHTSLVLLCPRLQFLSCKIWIKHFLTVELLLIWSSVDGEKGPFIFAGTFSIFGNFWPSRVCQSWELAF